MLYAFVVMVLGSLAMLCVPELLLKMFSASDEMIRIGVPAFRIIAIAFLFTSYGIPTSNFFQAVGNGILSMMLSLIRQLLVLVPVAYLLGYTLGYEFSWWAIPFAEMFAAFVAVGGWFYIKRKILNKLPNGCLEVPTVSDTENVGEGLQTEEMEEVENLPSEQPVSAENTQE